MSPSVSPRRNVQELFAHAEQQGRTRIARKTKPVDARHAMVGEVIVAIIKGEEIESKNKPAETGDMVVRNRCPAPDNEQYLVKGDAFSKAYRGPLSAPSAEGWCEFIPVGRRMQFFLVNEAEGCFTFIAPWGEVMVARHGDAIVRSLDEPSDIYRVSASSFACTYEILGEPPTKSV
jgi:hypothetical protein